MKIHLINFNAGPDLYFESIISAVRNNADKGTSESKNITIYPMLRRISWFIFPEENIRWVANQSRVIDILIKHRYITWS